MAKLNRKKVIQVVVCSFFLMVQVLTDACDTRYRTFDGTCTSSNNITRHGAAGTSYQRLMRPIYADDAEAVRRSELGGDLPSPRLVSTAVTITESVSSSSATQWMMAFGQFVDHDLTRTALSTLPNGGPITCCSGVPTGGFLSSPNPECLPISIPIDDPVFKNVRCMTATRSRPAKNEDGTNRHPRDQINLNTHWIDGSHIYGSSNVEANNLRDRSTGKGQLKISMSDDGRVMLPVDGTCCAASTNNTCDLAKSCFFAGDFRVREHPLLTMQHLLWVREHNRIANELVKALPGGTDEFYFQEARRIVVAQFQQIVYEEWLPTLIGNALATQPPSNRKPNEIPACYNEFVTAAYRMGHSMIRSFFWLYEADGSRSSMSYFLRDAFSKAGPQLLQPGFVDNAIRGLLQMPIQSVDHCFAEDITSMLFKQPSKPLGFDLVALNVNRGRDHGLPTYAQARSDAIGYLGQKAPPPLVNEFDELGDTHSAEVIASFKKVYKSVGDIDLFIGGVTEAPLPRAMVGRTFASIIARQFEILRRTDKFFYTKKFNSPSQQTELKKTSMAKILCDNSDGTLVEVQKNVFLPPSAANEFVECKDFPKVNVTALL